MTGPTPLEAIRLHAQDMLAEDRYDGRAAVLLGLIANAERRMAAARLEERQRIVAWLRSAGHPPDVALAALIERGAHLEAT